MDVATVAYWLSLFYSFLQCEYYNLFIVPAIDIKVFALGMQMGRIG